MELVPIVLAAAAWGTTWRGLSVLCHSDNSAVASQINSLHAQDLLACNILRCLAFFQAHFDFRMHAVYVAGKENVGADLLSRNRAAAFLARFPHASPLPSQVHQGLIQLLCLEPAEWTSLRWRERFTFWRQAFLSQQRRSTEQVGTVTCPLSGHSLCQPQQ